MATSYSGGGKQLFKKYVYEHYEKQLTETLIY